MISLSQQRYILSLSAFALRQGVDLLVPCATQACYLFVHPSGMAYISLLSLRNSPLWLDVKSH
jgi:hypothetical protein